MSPLPPYEYHGPVKAASEALDLSSLVGKSVVITGGASGLGKAFAKAFVDAGAYVTIGDINDEVRGKAVIELGSNAQSVHCDVRDWDEQVSLFEAAMANSPAKSIDIVIANAGLGAMGDALVMPEGPDPTIPPPKPDLTILDVNLKGTLYTSRLALHYFRRQNSQASQVNGHVATNGSSGTATPNRNLILMGSMSAYIDWKFSLQYPVTKAGVRSLMKCLRRSAFVDGVRVNMIAPGYIDTPMIPPPLKQLMLSQGMEFGQTEDVVRAVMRISTDTTINVEGRSFGVFDRKRTPEGYMDLDVDDYKEGDLIYPMEKVALAMQFR